MYSFYGDDDHCYKKRKKGHEILEMNSNIGVHSLRSTFTGNGSMST